MRSKFIDGFFGLPKSIAIIGWGFFAWGLYTLVCMIMGIIAMLLIYRIMPGYMERIIEAMNNPIVTFMMRHWIFTLFFSFLISIVMVLSGLFFLQRKKWARYMLETFCWYMIITNLINFYYLPRMDITKFMPAIPNLPPQAMNSMVLSSITGMIAGFFFSLMLLAMIVILIIFLHTSKFKKLYVIPT